MASTAQIDLTEVVLSVPALAGDREAVIPARIRLPTACAIAFIVASVVTSVTAVTAVIGRDEPARTAAIYPQAALIDAPIFPTLALRVRKLTLQSGVAPRHDATLALKILAGAFDRAIAVMSSILRLDTRRCGKSCRRENKSNSDNCSAHDVSPVIAQHSRYTGCAAVSVRQRTQYLSQHRARPTLWPAR